MPAPVTARVTWVAPTNEVLFAIDHPEGVVESDALSFVCAGWVYGRTTEIGAVEITAGEDQLRWLPLKPRPDIDTHLAAQGIDTRGIGTSFYSRISVLGLPDDTDVTVKGQRSDGDVVDLAVIHVTRSRMPRAFAPTLEPILVLSAGRSGSTWLMDVLSRHPRILVHGEQPYEMRAAHYWMHLVRSLCDEPIADEPPESFTQRPSTVTPFAYAIPGQVADDFATSHAHVREIVKYALNAVDDFYGTLARHGRKTRARYFAEKGWFERRMPGLFNELYSGARNVFVIRDPRDVMASVLAFNRARGWDGFSRDRMDSDEVYARFLTRYIIRGLTIGEQLPTSVVVRYEDLVTSPAEVIRRVFDYCGLDSDPATVATAIGAVDAAGSIPDEHRTSASASESIGRWRHELTPSVVEAIESTMGDALARIGYAPEPSRAEVGGP